MKPSSSSSPMDDNDDKGRGDGEEDPNTRSTSTGTTPPVDGSGSEANGTGLEASAEESAGSPPDPKVARKKKVMKKTNDSTTTTTTPAPANSSKAANKKGKAARPFLTGREGATIVTSVVSSASSYEPPTFVRLDRPSPSTTPPQEQDEAAEAIAASALPPPSLPSPVDAGGVAHGVLNEPPPEERLPVARTVDTSGVPTAAPVDLLATAGEDDKYDEEVNASEKTRRRRSLLLLGTVALVGVTVGLSMGLTSTAPAPASNGTTPLFDPDQFAVDSRCWDKYNAFNRCFGGDDNSSSTKASLCGNCVANYYKSVLDLNLGEVYNVTSCQAIDNETCDALASCSAECDTCTQEFVTYFECVSLCSLTGTTCKAPTPSTAPAATPSPTSSQLECREEYVAFSDCVESTGPVSRCEQCIIDRNSVGGILSCSDYQKLTCKLMDNCPACGDCEDTFLPYWNCLIADTCPAFDCASPTLQPS